MFFRLLAMVRAFGVLAVMAAMFQPTLGAGPSCPGGTDVECDAGDVCDSATGECVVDLCIGVSCDEGDECTVNSCDPATGDCLAGPLCDDGDNCTADNCDAGVCDFVPTVCDEGFACNPTNGLCEATVCTSDSECDDGLFCTGEETCDPADPDADADGCVATGDPCGGETPVCNETSGACEAESPPETAVCCFGTSCEDNTLGEMYCIDEGGTPMSGVTCADNPCTGCVADLECDDGVDCTDDTCDSGSGTCTNADNCTTGSCLGGADPTICD